LLHWNDDSFIIRIGITRNTRSWNGLAISIFLFGDNIKMTKFFNWIWIIFFPKLKKYPSSKKIVKWWGSTSTADWLPPKGLPATLRKKKKKLKEKREHKKVFLEKFCWGYLISTEIAILLFFVFFEITIPQIEEWSFL